MSGADKAPGPAAATAMAYKRGSVSTAAGAVAGVAHHRALARLSACPPPRAAVFPSTLT